MINKLNKQNAEQISEDFSTQANDFKAENLGDTQKNGREKINKLEGSIPKPLLEIWNDLKLLISLIGDFITRRYTNIPIKSVLAVGAAVAYFVSPIDAIPDIIPVIGYLDDALVIKLALDLIGDDLKEYVIWKENKKIA